MSACKWMADMLLAMFTVYLFVPLFWMFFEGEKRISVYCLELSCLYSGSRNPGGYQ